MLLSGAQSLSVACSTVSQGAAARSFVQGAIFLKSVPASSAARHTDSDGKWVREFVSLVWWT